MQDIAIRASVRNNFRCCHCGAEFKPLRRRPRFCSSTCRVAAHRKPDCNANSTPHSHSEAPPALVCNKTNATRIATALGDKDYNAWAGKQIRLYPDMEEFKGQVHEVVRIRRAPGPIAEDLNDKVAF